MRIYFDGCSYTYGAELSKRLDNRYSSLVSKKLGAEEYNVSMCGSSNRRLARNLMEHNLDQYDFFVIQMTKRLRTEYYDGSQWQKVKYNTRTKDVGDKNPQKEFWTKYYHEIYHDEFGKSDEKIFYTLIRALLKNKPHVIIGLLHNDSIFSPSCNVPADLIYRRGSLPKAEFGHPNEDGHKILANDIVNYYEGLH